MLAVFDLDGTLIDNKEAVRYAYLRAGVAMPDDAWGKPVGDWCTKEQHEMKQSVYFNSLLEYGRRGPGIGFWTSIGGAPKVIITGASLRSAYDSLDFLQTPRDFLAMHGASLREKVAWVKGAMTVQPVLYVDSDSSIANEIWKETKCHILVPA